jgi:hypothetical protein
VETPGKRYYESIVDMICLGNTNFLSFMFLLIKKNWGESHILEEMHENGRLGAAEGVSAFGVVLASHHQEFSDMCMITPLWLARGTGATGTRNPLETAHEIEKRTW